jgi:hypothetical protein
MSSLRDEVQSLQWYTRVCTAIDIYRGKEPFITTYVLMFILISFEYVFFYVPFRTGANRDKLVLDMNHENVIYSFIYMFTYTLF